MKKFLGLILLMLLPCSALSMWGQTGQQMKLISYTLIPQHYYKIFFLST